MVAATQCANYEDLTEDFIFDGATVDPAYIHGLMVGYLCAHPEDSASCWQVIQKKTPSLARLSDTTIKSIELLICQAQSQLQDEALSLSLLLPADEASFMDQLSALAYWAEGMTQGVEWGLETAQQLLVPEAVKEILADFAEIATLKETEEATNDNQKHFIELVEFVRVGSLLLFEECQEAKQAEQQAATNLH